MLICSPVIKMVLLDVRQQRAPHRLWANMEMGQKVRMWRSHCLQVGWEFVITHNCTRTVIYYWTSRSYKCSANLNVPVEIGDPILHIIFPILYERNIVAVLHSNSEGSRSYNSFLFRIQCRIILYTKCCSNSHILLHSYLLNITSVCVAWNLVV